MFLSDLRGRHRSHGSREKLTCLEDAPGPSHVGTDDQLIADCRALTSQVAAMRGDVEKASVAEASEHEFLMASLRQADDRLVGLIERIRNAGALTDRGIECKHHVVDLLLSIDCCDDPSPHRDALVLSFLRDAGRIPYPVVVNDGALAGKPLAAARTVIRSGRICLRVIEKLTAGFKKWEQADDLPPTARERLAASLSDLSQWKRALVRRLSESPAPCATALEAKRLVLQRLLEIGTSDTCELRVELSRSYLSDLTACIRANGLGWQEPVSGASSIWSSISSTFRWLTSSASHR